MSTHEDIQRALAKKGFKVDDALYHECPQCKERALEIWVLRGKGGGRDVELCGKCGGSWSWRLRPMQEREQDTAFEVKAFVGLT